MKKPQKVLSAMGILGAPLVLSLLSMAIPKFALVVMFVLGIVFTSGFAFTFAVAVMVAAALGLVGGQGDPLRPFAFALL